MQKSTVPILMPDGTVREMPLAPQAQQRAPNQPLSFNTQEPQQVERVNVQWYPHSNSRNEIQLSDGTYLVGIPDTVMSEPDEGSRVVLALLGEVLMLRSRIEQLEARPVAPPPPPPGQMGSPVPELQGDAKSFREQAIAETAKQTASQNVKPESEKSED